MSPSSLVSSQKTIPNVVIYRMKDRGVVTFTFHSSLSKDSLSAWTTWLQENFDPRQDSISSLMRGRFSSGSLNLAPIRRQVVAIKGIYLSSSESFQREGFSRRDPRWTNVCDPLLKLSKWEECLRSCPGIESLVLGLELRPISPVHSSLSIVLATNRSKYRMAVWVVKEFNLIESPILKIQSIAREREEKNFFNFASPSYGEELLGSGNLGFSCNNFANASKGWVLWYC